MYGGAELALKEVLQGRRDKVVVATKVWTETADEAEKLFHESLKVMGLDHVDILHLHSSGDKSMDKVMGKGGSWEFLEKAKAAGKTRFLGMTGHSRPANFIPLIETGKVDVLMVALNFVDRHIYGFEEKVLPAARKQKMGILAMKVYGGVKGGFPNYPSRTPHPSQMDSGHHVRSVAYAKSLEGVTGMVIGVHSREQPREHPEGRRDAAALRPRMSPRPRGGEGARTGVEAVWAGGVTFR
jgi:predicted aldo/keto reductase-like oxidoreductase